MNKKTVLKPIHPILFILTLFIFSLSVFAYDIPNYNGQDAVTINNNVPEDLSSIESGLHLSELDVSDDAVLQRDSLSSTHLPVKNVEVSDILNHPAGIRTNIQVS